MSRSPDLSLRTSLRALAAALALAVTAGTAFAADAVSVIDLRGDAARSALAGYEQTLAANSADAQALKNAGIVLHQLARSEPKPETVERAENYLQQAKKLSPDDPEISAWLGSTITMKALFETDPGRQTFHVKAGTRLLDAAVRAAPDNRIVRLTRAYNSLELPPFLGRTRYAVEDLGRYLQLCDGQPCAAADVSEAREKLALAERIVEQNR